jgi:Concanavalin A-like lectin/glucanases superfamily
MSNVFDVNKTSGIISIISLTIFCVFIVIALALSIRDTRVKHNEDFSLEVLSFFFKAFFIDYLLSTIIGCLYFIKAITIGSLTLLRDIFITTIQDFYTNMKDSPEYRSCVFKYGLLYGFILTIFVGILSTAKDPSFLTSKTYIYSVVIILSLIAIIYYVIPFSSSSGDNKIIPIVSIGSIITFIGCLIYFYTTTNSPTVIFTSYLLNAIIFLSIISALAIFFYLFSNYLKSSTGFVGFLIYFIFYIPCLLIDFAKYIINEFKMTTNVVYVLFILEIVLILLYIYVPQIISYMIVSDGTVLLPGSHFLDKETILSDSRPFRMTDVELKKRGITPNFDISDMSRYRKEYCLSMWIYINAQLNNTQSYGKEVPIFCYGSNNTDPGKPRITYTYNKPLDKNKDIIKIYFTDSTTELISSYEYTIQQQKWTNVVINYIMNRADLFINGTLVKSFAFDVNEPEYDNNDKIFIGSNNGIDGAICNVRYLNNAQTKIQIVNQYNLLMKKNPPTQL